MRPLPNRVQPCLNVANANESNQFAAKATLHARAFSHRRHEMRQGLRSMSAQSAAPAASDRPPADDGFKLLRHMARKGEVELKKAQESTLIVLGDR